MAHRDPKKEKRGKNKRIREKPKNTPYKKPKKRNWIELHSNNDN